VYIEMYVYLNKTTEAISRFLKSSPNLGRGGHKIIETETDWDRVLPLYRPFQYRDPVGFE